VDARSSATWFCISRTRVASSLFTWSRDSRFCWRAVWEGWWLENAEIRFGSLRMDWRSRVLELLDCYRGWEVEDLTTCP
jgi:hypothetical protein